MRKSSHFIILILVICLVSQIVVPLYNKQPSKPKKGPIVRLKDSYLMASYTEKQKERTSLLCSNKWSFFRVPLFVLSALNPSVAGDNKVI